MRRGLQSATLTVVLTSMNRAGEGLDAISELDPGLVTGPLSTVWRDIIKDLVQHFHLGPDQLIVAPYDWRLPPSKLQERDRYFYQLMKKSKLHYELGLCGRLTTNYCFRLVAVEYTVDLNGGDALVVIAHSMGNNMLRYFLAWLKLEIGVNHWQEWIDKHISAYFAVGAPLLGSAEALELITSGVTNGLPVSLSAIRQMVVSFGMLSQLPLYDQYVYNTKLSCCFQAPSSASCRFQLPLTRLWTMTHSSRCASTRDSITTARASIALSTTRARRLRRVSSSGTWHRTTLSSRTSRLSARSFTSKMRSWTSSRHGTVHQSSRSTPSTASMCRYDRHAH